MLKDPRWDKAEQQVEIDEVGRVLLKALELIRDHGWTQGTNRNALGQMCLLGAIDRATVGVGLYGQAVDRMHRYLKEDPATWNDRMERTALQVMAALNGAAWLYEHGCKQPCAKVS